MSRRCVCIDGPRTSILQLRMRAVHHALATCTRRNLFAVAGCLTLALRQVRAAAQRARPHGPRPGHEVAHASCARGVWCLRACATRGDGSRGGRSCLVFSTHDRAGEVKRTGGSEASGPLVRRRSGPRIQREGSVVFGSKCMVLAVSNLHISTSGGLSAARPRTPYFNFFKLSKN